MKDFTTPQGQTSKDTAGKAPAATGGYKSKLDEILAKAGNNNPIAAAQAKNLGKTQPQAPSQPLPQTTGTAPQPPVTPVTATAQQPAAPVTPTVPVAPAAPGAAQDPNDRLQQILAMAGKTPAQRAQAQAQQNLANNAANIAQMLGAYMQAVSQDPRKLLCCDIEFSSNAGANTEIYFKCYADAAGNIYWDVFGEDIDYTVQNQKIAGYGLFDNYYRGVPDADFRTDMAQATVHSNSIV